MADDKYAPKNGAGKFAWDAIKSPLQTQPEDAVFDKTGGTAPSSAAKPHK